MKDFDTSHLSSYSSTKSSDNLLLWKKMRQPFEGLTISRTITMPNDDSPILIGDPQSISKQEVLLSRHFDENEYRVRAELRLKLIAVTSMFATGIVLIISGVVVLFSAYADAVATMILTGFGVLIELATITVIFRPDRPDNTSSPAKSASLKSEYFNIVRGTEK